MLIKNINLKQKNEIQKIEGGFKIKNNSLKSEYFFETQFDVFGPYNGYIYYKDSMIHCFYTGKISILGNKYIIEVFTFFEKEKTFKKEFFDTIYILEDKIIGNYILDWNLLFEICNYSFYEIGNCKKLITSIDKNIYKSIYSIDHGDNFYLYNMNEGKNINKAWLIYNQAIIYNFGNFTFFYFIINLNKQLFYYIKDKALPLFALGNLILEFFMIAFKPINSGHDSFMSFYLCIGAIIRFYGIYDIVKTYINLNVIKFFYGIFLLINLFFLIAFIVEKEPSRSYFPIVMFFIFYFSIFFILATFYGIYIYFLLKLNYFKKNLLNHFLKKCIQI